MARRIMADFCGSARTGANWSGTGALDAGRIDRGPRCNIELAEISHSEPAPVGFNNWSKTGANWSSKGASAPVVFPPLKGGNNHNWSSAPVRLQNWSGEFGA